MRIRTLRAFSGVPEGTKGEAEIEKDNEYSPHGSKWKITWDLTHDSAGRPRFKPLVDWFTQDEFDAFLVEI
jgi:hypothetical protein